MKNIIGILLLSLITGCTSTYSNIEPNLSVPVSLSIDSRKCWSIQLQPNVVLTAGHCAFESENSFAQCKDVQKTKIVKWHSLLDSNYNIQSDDLAIAILQDPLPDCYQPIKLAAPVLGETVHFYTASFDKKNQYYLEATVQDISGQHIIVNTWPNRICKGKSGSPMFNKNNELVGVISHVTEEQMDGKCSFYPHLINAYTGVPRLQTFIKENNDSLY